MSDAITKLYDVKEEEDRLVITFLQPKLSKAARMSIAIKSQPEELKLTRPLALEELKTMDWIELGDKPVVIKAMAGKEEMILPFCRYLSPKAVEQAGGSLLTNLIRIREIVCDPVFNTFMQKVHPDRDFAEKRGTTYDLLFTVEPGHRQKGTHLSQIVRSDWKGGENLRELNQLCAEAYMASLEASGMKRDNTQRWVFQASITAGHHDNHDMASSQLNIAPMSVSVGGALRKKGKEHVDKNDDTTRSTVLLFLSNLPDNYYEGRMNIYSARLTCSAEKFGVLVFTGRHPHSASGIGEYPNDFPVDKYTYNTTKLSTTLQPLPADWPKLRASMPCYPKTDLTRPIDGTPNEELFGPHAIKAFGTMRNYQEWKLRTEVKEKRTTTIFNVDELIERFSWINELGEKEGPRKWIADMAVNGWKEYDNTFYDKWHKAALWADCGTLMPWDHEKRKLKREEKKTKEESVESDEDVGMKRKASPGVEVPSKRHREKA